VSTPSLEKQIAGATRSVEEFRRVAHRDPVRLGELVDQIYVLGELRQQEGDLRKAESLYREALFRIQETRPPDATLLFGVCSVLAHLYDRWGKSKEAAEFYRQALDVARQPAVQERKRVATMKNNLAVLLKNQRAYDEAQTLYEEALADFRAAEGDDSLSVASVCHNLGALFYQNLEVDRALELHLAALRIREQAPRADLDPAELWQSCMSLAAVYKALGDFQNAERFVAKASGLDVPSRRGAVADARRPIVLMLDRTV
jgi:tetratricopeptide (TPR) repeat protein